MRTLLATIVIGCLATAAAAEEFQVGARVSTEYDSNLFNSEENEVDDTAVRVTPIIGLRRTQGRFVYDLRYQPRFETWLDGSTDDDWDQNVFGRASWQMSPRTTLRATERFLITKSQNRAGFITDPGQPDASPTTGVEVARQELTRNLLGLGADHVFTPRLTGNLDFGYDIFRTDRDDRFDSDTLRGSAQASYMLSARNRVGGGLRITWTDVKDTDTQNGSKTFYYTLFASWVYQFDPTMTLDARVGPTLVDSSRSGDAPPSATVSSFPFRAAEGGGLRLIDSNTCPTTDGQPFLNEDCGLFGTQLTGPSAASIQSMQTMVFQADDRSGSDLKPTIFANIRFTKSWEHVRLSLGYRRTDSTATGAGQATVLDFVNGSVSWTPTQAWALSAAASFANRQSATDQGANVLGLGPPEGLTLPGTMGPVMATGSPSVNLRQAESDDLTSVQTWRTTLLVTRYIGKARRSRVFARFSYLHQDGDSFGEERKFDDYRLGAGFQYLFDWTRLW
jgi:hypothetical protein